MCRGVEPSAKGFSLPWNAKNNTDEGRRVFSCAMCYIQTSVQTPYHKSVSVEYKSKSFLASSSYRKNHMKCFLPLATTATLFVKCQSTRVICLPSVCVCVLCMCVYLCVSACAYKYVHICEQVYVCVCFCVYKSMDVHVSVHAYTSVLHACVCMCVCCAPMCACVCMCNRMCVYERFLKTSLTESYIYNKIKVLFWILTIINSFLNRIILFWSHMDIL